MNSLARFCFRQRKAVLALWIVLLVGLGVAVGAAGTAFTEIQEMPDSESASAYALLGAGEGAAGTERGTIVWRTDKVAVDAPGVEAEVTAMLDELLAQPGVEAVVSPYTDAGAGQLNAGAGTAYAVVTVVADDFDLGQVREIADGLETSSSGLDVALGGQPFTEQPASGGMTEGIGVIVALVLLLFMFKSGWAAALPIATGVMGVGVSLLAVMLGSHVIDLPDTAITMGALIGLAVGIDYALFIVNRHRKALMAGASVEDGIAESVNTSGRAVIFAGLTVIVALVAMFIVDLPVLTAMGRAAALTVLTTVITALTLLPALLGLIGTNVLSKRQRAALAAGETTLAPSAQRIAGPWSRLVERRPRTMATAGIALLVILALPVLSIRVGNSDASSDPEGSPGREYSELIAPAFGAGHDAGLVLVTELPDTASVEAFNTLLAELPSVDNVAAVSGAPAGVGQAVGVISVTPGTSAQAEETEQLVDTLRGEVIPAAEAGTSMQIYVGGETATNIDLSAALMDKLPLFLVVVALLGFILLAIAFRSLVVPLVGAVSNLATMLVGLGALTAIFQWGWGTGLLGVGDAAPIMYIVPILLVGVMFGLSMDYQVFLVSRMHEEWTHTGDNHRAVRVGIRETAQVIAVAATIMLAVFASFGFSGERIISAIGIGLAIAVLVDAFVLRLMVVPALMHLIGPRNWAYPKLLEAITPHVSVEGAPAPQPAPASVIETTVHTDVDDGDSVAVVGR